VAGCKSRRGCVSEREGNPCRRGARREIHERRLALIVMRSSATPERRDAEIRAAGRSTRSVTAHSRRRKTMRSPYRNHRRHTTPNSPRAYSRRVRRSSRRCNRSRHPVHGSPTSAVHRSATRRRCARSPSRRHRGFPALNEQETVDAEIYAVTKDSVVALTRHSMCRQPPETTAHVGGAYISVAVHG